MFALAVFVLHRNTPHLCPLTWYGMCPAVSVPHLCPLLVWCVSSCFCPLIFVLSWYGMCPAVSVPHLCPPGMECVQLSLSLIFVLLVWNVSSCLCPSSLSSWYGMCPAVSVPHLCPLTWYGMCPAVSVPHFCPLLVWCVYSCLCSLIFVLSPGVECVQLSLSLVFVLSPGVKCVPLAVFVLHQNIPRFCPLSWCRMCPTSCLCSPPKHPSSLSSHLVWNVSSCLCPSSLSSLSWCEMCPAVSVFELNQM